VLHLALAGGAVGAAVALSKPGKRECNEFHECRVVEERSDLIPVGVAAAAVLSLYGAIEAWRYAGRSGPGYAPGEDDDIQAASGPGLAPGLAASGAGVRLELRILH
jgi:hypothetical protein